MKFVIATLILASSWAFAATSDTTIKLNVKNDELLNVIETYSKASGQKFVIDPAVRGKVSILNQQPITLPEAFNQLSSALAINGFAISTQGDTMVIKSARNIQRDLVEVSTELPSLKPERMATWIVTFKNIPATTVNRDLRIFPSKDGEMNVSVTGNQLIMTDWTANLHRISEIVKQIDKPVDPATAKLVAEAQKEQRARHKEHMEKNPPAPPKEKPGH
ncbi:Type II secretion system protein D precursor [compost metagenome]